MRNILFAIIAALLIGCAGTPSRSGVNRFTLLPHEIENFERGKTTYHDAVKELGRPLKSEQNTAGKHAQWTERMVSGHHWTYRDVHAQFNKADVLQDYTVHLRPVPIFGLGHR